MNNDNLHKVIDKIRKLLAMSTSPNPEEAASFLSKAKQLMFEYNISEQDVNESVSDIIEIDFVLAHSNEDYLVKFSYWISKAFNVKSIMIKRNIGTDRIKFEKNIRFIGKVSDVAVSSFIFSYISDVLETKSNEYIKYIKSHTNSAKVKKEFCLGFVEAVCQKLKLLEEQEALKMTVTDVENSKALVCTTNALINQYMNEKYGEKLHEGNDKTEKVDAKNFENGFIEGEKQGLYRGVSTPNKNTMIGE